MKKLVALILSLCMLLSVGSMAMADKGLCDHCRSTCGGPAACAALPFASLRVAFIIFS